MVLSGLKWLDEIVDEEVRNMPIEIDIMENSTIRRWIEQGVEKREASILGKQLAKRFGALTPETEEKLQSGNSDQLERWIMRLMDAHTLEEVFSA